MWFYTPVTGNPGEPRDSDWSPSGFWQNKLLPWAFWQGSGILPWISGRHDVISTDSDKGVEGQQFVILQMVEI